MAPQRRHLRLLTLLLPLLLLPLLPPAPVRAAPLACAVAATQAMTQQGATYSQGGALPGDPIDPLTGQPMPRTGPDSFDCSGLVHWAYQQADLDVGWTTYQQVTAGRGIGCGLGDLAGSATTCWAPGDLVFARYSGGQHVAIYVGDGLFMDCYNHAAGCVLHDIAAQDFYQRHFWQARRVAEGCDGLTFYPGAADPTPGGAPIGEYPQFAAMPDVLGYLALRMPQCDECVEGGAPVLTVPPISDAPPLPSMQDWVAPSNPDSWFSVPVPNPGNGFRMIFTWLTWHITRLFLFLICWLLIIAQWVLDAATTVANAFIGATNIVWRFALFAWLTLRQWVYGVWSFLELSRDFFVWMQQAAVYVWAWLVALYDLLLIALGLAGAVLTLLWRVVAGLLGLLGWVAALTIQIMLDLLLAFQGTLLPAQLSADEPLYYLLRGVLDAINDSPLGWIMLLLIGLAYVAAIMWVGRFLPAGREG